MRWAALILLLANLAVGAYLLLIDRQPRALTDLRTLEMNADKVRPVEAAAPVAPVAKVPAPAPAAAAACLEWGSFTAAELERAQEQLARLKPGVTRVRELTGFPAWWVHVPPLRSRDEAERRARDIELLGIQDVRVVTDGDRWRNAVSLGIFKSAEAANAYLEQMRESKVRNVAVTPRNDLLRLALIVIADPAPALVTRVMELRAAFPGTEVKASACTAEAG